MDKLLQQQSTATLSITSTLLTEPIFERCLIKYDVDLLEEKVKARNVFKGRLVSWYLIGNNSIDMH